MFWLQPCRSEPIYLTSLSLPARSDPWAQEPAAADIKTCWAVLHPLHYITPQKDEIEARSANHHPGVFMLNVLWNWFFCWVKLSWSGQGISMRGHKPSWSSLITPSIIAQATLFSSFFFRWCNIWAPQTGNLITFKIKVEKKEGGHHSFGPVYDNKGNGPDVLLSNQDYVC